MTAYVLKSICTKVEERFQNVNYRKVDGEFVHDKESQGWFVVVEHFGSAFYVGTDQPDLRPGDRIRVTISKIPASIF